MRTSRESARDTVSRVLVACTRAIAGDRNLDVAFSRNNAPMHDLAVIRGRGDAVALRRAHHDAQLHERTAPAPPRARALYDALEQVRVEAMGALSMRGMANNLDAALEHALAHDQPGDPRQPAAAPFDTAVALMARTRITGMPLPASGEAVAAMWRDAVEHRLGTMLDALPQHVYDQDAFARIVVDHLGTLEAGEARERQPQCKALPPDGKGAEVSHEAPAHSDAVPAEHTDRDARPWAHRPARLRAARMHADADPGYRIFTTAFDRIAFPSELRSPQELQRLRQALYRQRARYGVPVGRLAARLQRHLMARQNRAWDFDLEEGELDSARLERIIVDPAQPLSFKQERESSFRDTTVTVLIDNSGSMHGRAIAIAAVCADLLACTLERCGVGVEILGFTTGAWQGGSPREQWLRAGRPAAPGRLNQTCHIIYKAAGQPLRRARTGLGLMMCNDVLKENIDGEALLWAHQRLLARPEQRRVLMVISDGAPADDATLSSNPRDYLERHLRNVAGMIEARSPVELVAVGIGHDVGRYYATATTVAEPEQLAGALTGQLVRLFAAEGTRRHPAAAPGSA